MSDREASIWSRWFEAKAAFLERSRADRLERSARAAARLQTLRAMSRTLRAAPVIVVSIGSMPRAWNGARKLIAMEACIHGV